MAATAKTIRSYSVAEEIVHAASHGLGVAFALVALVMLVTKAVGHGGTAVTAVSIYAGSMVLMYLCSTLYHAAFRSRHQPFLKMLDHSSIYFKIAGGYTPFALISLPSTTGLWVMAGAWIAALTGTGFKFVAYLKKSGKKFNWVSLAIYLGMGWAGILMVGPLAEVLPSTAIVWLLAGGAFYTVGAIFYAIKSVAYFHAVWHLFVLAGSACHFVAIYWYVV